MFTNKPEILAFFVVLSIFGVACFISAPLKDYARAQQLQTQGKAAEALELYQRVLPQWRPDEARLRSETQLHIGECLFQLGRPSEAFTAFRKAADIDDSNAAAHLRMGELLLASGSVEKAADEAKQVLASGAASADAMACTRLGRSSSL